MPSQSRVYQNRSLIIEALKAQGQKIFTKEEIKGLLEYNREEWRLSQSSTKRLLMQLEDAGIVEAIEFRFANGSSKQRYLFDAPSPVEVAFSFVPDGYLSHRSAAVVHKLQNKDFQEIYVTQEQRPKSAPAETLSQAKIDEAFKRPQRTSNLYTAYRSSVIYLLNGKQVNKAGVLGKNSSYGFAVTNLERTLIDLTVRPAYAGGVKQTMESYRNAIAVGISLPKLVSLLDSMNFTYPYHQAIGYYLQAAGYNDSDISLLKAKPMNFDFHLDYAIQHNDYCSEWKVFVPKN